MEKSCEMIVLAKFKTRVLEDGALDWILDDMSVEKTFKVMWGFFFDCKCLSPDSWSSIDDLQIRGATLQSELRCLWDFVFNATERGSLSRFPLLFILRRTQFCSTSANLSVESSIWLNASTYFKFVAYVHYPYTKLVIVIMKRFFSTWKIINQSQIRRSWDPLDRNWTLHRHHLPQFWYDTSKSDAE